MPIDTNPSVYNDLFFQSLIEGYVTNNKRFLRRDWLAAEIDTHLADPACRFVLLTAEPGFGKSVFMAQLAADHPNWPRYFIRRDQCSPLADVGSRSFLLRIGYQLAARYPELFDKDAVRLSVEQRIGDVVDRGTVVGAEIQKIVASPFHVNISKLVEIRQQVANVAGKVVGLRIGELAIEPHLLDSVTLQHIALIEPARAMQRLHPDHQIVIMVDALDEIRYHQTEDNILTWLRNCPDLPANVHFVLTARPPADDVRLFIDKQQSALYKIDLTSQGGEPAAKLRYQALNDVVIYVAALAENAQIKLHLAAQPDGVVGFKQQAVTKSDGNIGYLDALARAIDQSLSNQDEKSLAVLLAVKSLPDDIQGLYAFFLHQIKVKIGDIKVLIEMLATGARDFVPMWLAIYDPFLAVLAVAREPMTLEQIQRLGGITAQWSDLNAAKDNLLQFLDVVGNRYRLYHATLPEFLTDEHTKENSERQDLYIDAENWHRRIGRFYWQTCHDDWSRCDDYGLAHLPAHLSAASMATELHSLLFGFGWLRTKLARLRINALLADFSLPGTECNTAVQDLRTALRQGAHVLGQTPDQLASQMHGRLCDDTSVEIRALLDEAVQVQTQSWLRPLTPSLREPSALLRTLTGHTDGICGVALSRDGSIAVSASEDTTLKVWDVIEGKELRTLKGHTGWVIDVALSSDMRIAVSASLDNTLKLWDVDNGKEVRTFQGHSAGIMSVMLLEDERLAASISRDGMVKVWDVSNGRELRTIKDPISAFRVVALSRDEKLAVSETNDGKLRFWDVESGKECRTRVGSNGNVWTVKLSQDGRFAISAPEDTALQVWDVATGTELHLLKGHLLESKAVAISADGKRAVSASDDHTLKVWDVASGEKLCSLEGHTDRVRGVAISEDGRWVVSASLDKTLRVWDLMNGGKSLVRASHTAKISSLAISGDGRLAISASYDGTLKVWDVNTHSELHTLDSGIAVMCVAMNRHGKLAVSASYGEILTVWDVQKGSALRTLEGHKDVILCVAMSENGDLVISSSSDGTLRLWSVKTSKELHTLNVRPGSAVAISRDGRLAVSALQDYTLKTWEVQGGTELSTFKGHKDMINAVALSADTTLAVSASSDRTLRVWDVANAKELRLLGGHTDAVMSVTLSEDGKLAFSASTDGTLKVWEIATGLCITTFVADGAMSSCAVAPDGRTILAGGDSARIHFLWLERPIAAG